MNRPHPRKNMPSGKKKKKKRETFLKTWEDLKGGTNLNDTHYKI